MLMRQFLDNHRNYDHAKNAKQANQDAGPSTATAATKSNDNANGNESNDQSDVSISDVDEWEHGIYCIMYCGMGQNEIYWLLAPVF